MGLRFPFARETDLSVPRLTSPKRFILLGLWLPPFGGLICCHVGLLFPGPFGELRRPVRVCWLPVIRWR